MRSDKFDLGLRTDDDRRPLPTRKSSASPMRLAVIVGVFVGVASAVAAVLAIQHGQREADRAKAMEFANRLAEAARNIRLDPVARPEPEPRAQTEWVEVPGEAILDDVRVTVDRAAVEPVKLIDGPRTERQTDEPHLVISIRVANESKTLKHDYRSWSDRSIMTSSDDASLGDDLGNRYRASAFGLGSYPSGSVRFASIYPGKDAFDVLVFEPPVDGASKLELVLPGERAGVNGDFRFVIRPAALVR